MTDPAAPRKSGTDDLTPPSPLGRATPIPYAGYPVPTCRYGHGEMGRVLNPLALVSPPPFVTRFTPGGIATDPLVEVTAGYVQVDMWLCHECTYIELHRAR